MSKLFYRSFIVLTTALLVASGFFVFAGTANAGITSLTLTAPNGGELWRGMQNITWTSTTDVGGGNNISILISTNGGGSYSTLVSSISSSLGTYFWDTTTSGAGPLADGNNYRIKISDPATLIDSLSAANFTVDNMPPTTTYAINPSSPDGLNGWYISTPTITLICDDDAGSGCNNTYYKWDGAASYITYAGPFSALEGEHVLSFYSEDNAVDNLGTHNVETAQAETIKVDTAVPSVAVTSATPNGSYKEGSDINVTLTFSEPVYSTDALIVTLDTSGTCSVPTLTNTITGTCTYTVGGGQNSSDLTVTSIVPTSGVVEDIAGNDSTLSPTSNIDNTSAIIIDTISPISFTVGAVDVTGGTIVSGWWNSTNTGVNVVVPVDNDGSFVGGTIQLQAEADGTYEDIGLPYIILVGDINNTKTLSLTATEIESITGFSDGEDVHFKAIITDLAGNATIGTESADSFKIDQTLPSVDAGTDKEVNAVVSQDATVSDGGSAVASYLWTGAGVISFSSSATEDTDISSTADGIYTITLTVTDNAGNVNFDTIQFAWDTIKPVITETTPIQNPTNDTTPSYVFNVDSVKQLASSTGGTITYAGTCGSGDLVYAIAGVNTTTYGTPTALVDATYSDCTIVVTDAAGNSNTAFSVSSFEIDTVTAVVVSSKTYDTNSDGKIDKAEITFDDELDDSTFLASNFTIGGVVADGFSTGATPDDAVIIITVSAGVAGTEAKAVAYTQGNATDLAGNVIASYSQTSTDLAGPILLSAKTKTTTTIDTIWSEDLDGGVGGTVNPSGNEFVVTGYSVSAADETSAGVVTLTVATMPTDAAPFITFTSANFEDKNGNDAPSPQSTTATDGVAPILTAVSIISDNALDTTLATAGDTITLTFTSSEAIATPVVVIQGASATTITDLGGGTSWTASREMLVGDTQGTVGFSIDFEDISPAANAGITVTAVTDGSSVFFDSVKPLVDAGTDKEVNAVVSQDATVSDPSPSSGILSYLWSNETISVGTITFGTPISEDTTISADTDGTYTIRLTVSDEAGNVNYDEIILIWDTTNPESITSSPSDGSTEISIASGVATVTFDEPIVLIDSSRILFVNDVTGASHKGTVTVNGGNPLLLDIPYSALDYGTKYRINIKAGNPITGVGAVVRDVAGNWLTNNWTSYFTTEIDTIPPVVNSSSASSITTTGAILNVTTNENANCRYATTYSDYASMTMPFTTTGATVHSVVLSGLIPSTGYDFYVSCADTTAQANEMITSAHISFTTLTPDTTPPAITNIQASVSDTTATITWTTDENATSRVEYGLISGYGNFSPADGTADNISHSVVISGLIPGTVYHFRALSDDAVPNSGISGDNTFTTTDTTAPAVPAFTTASTIIDADNYTVAGTVADDGGNRTISVYNGATLAGTTVVPTGSVAWSLLVPLTQDSANVFVATASDDAGNTSASSSSVTITEATTVGDTTAPETPVITTSPATVDADTYTIEGTAGADLLTDGPRTITIYNNGVVMGSIVLLTGETYWSFVASLSQDTANTFTAVSTDESGNTSVSSNSVIITEETVADTTAPVISNVQTDSIGINTATITWTTDEASTSQVEYGLTSAYGSSTAVDGTLTTSHSVIISGLDSNTVYHFRALSDDAVPNSGISGDNTFTTTVDDSAAILRVTNISAVKTFAIADDTYENGWSWLFNVTAPTSETELQMKFADWTSALLTTISVAGNVRYSSAEASNGLVEIIAANTYGDPLHLTGDLDTSAPGRQIQILVEARVPEGSAGGSYSTSYGITSNNP